MMKRHKISRILPLIAGLVLVVWFLTVPGSRQRSAPATSASLPENIEMEITAIDLRWFGRPVSGDAVLLHSGAEFLLMDCGRRFSAKSLIKALDREEVYSLDVYISHLHEDHYGCLEDVMKNYQVNTLYLPAEEYAPDGKNTVGLSFSKVHQQLKSLAEKHGVTIEYLAVGDSLTCGKAELQIIGPNNLLPTDKAFQYENNASLSSMITAGKTRYLTIGDLYVDGELDLAEHTDVKADILKVAHHGKRSSSGADFLAKVAPRIAIGCTASPQKEAVDRLREAVPEVYLTSQVGHSVKITCYDNGDLVMTKG